MWDGAVVEELSVNRKALLARREDTYDEQYVLRIASGTLCCEPAALRQPPTRFVHGRVKRSVRHPFRPT